MAKMGCAKCGGTKKMALGGSAVKKAPVQLYGIPQENMGTSSQMGFGKKGGTINANKKINAMNKVNKMQTGGSTTKYKPQPTYMSKKAVKEREAEMDKQKAEDYYAKNPGTRPSSYTDTISKPKSKGLFKKVSGSVNKMQVGGMSTTPKMSAIPKKPVVKKAVAPKKTTVSRKIIDSYIPMGGPDRLLKKPTMAKKGGSVNKMQDGGATTMSSSKTNMFGKTKEISKKKAENMGTRFASKKNHTFEDVGDGASYTIKPRANSNRSVTTTFKKVGGAVKTKKK